MAHDTSRSSASRVVAQCRPVPNGRILCGSAFAALSAFRSMIEESTSKGCIQRLRTWTEHYFSRLQEALYSAERDAQLIAQQGTDNSSGGTVNLPRVVAESPSRVRVVMMPPECEDEHVEM